MTYKINDEIKKVLMIINARGYEAYLVGGCIRDYFLSRPNKDYDICTNIPLTEIKSLWSNFKIMNENSHRHAGILRLNNYDIEISAFRGSTLKEDLSNRDFTMNALAVDAFGKVIDYFNGLDDIKNQRIALIKKNGQALEMDPLRILRAIRFSITLNFAIDENTLYQMEQKKSLLNEVAVERIYQELQTILVAPDIKNIIIAHQNIFFQLIPILKETVNFNQHNDYHNYDLFMHTLEVMNHLEGNIFLRLAGLFHDLGKIKAQTTDKQGKIHYLKHQSYSHKIFLHFASQYKIDNITTKTVSKLILYHEDILSDKKSKIYNFIKRYGQDNLDLLFALKEADILAQNPQYLNRLQTLAELKTKYYEVLNIMNNIAYDGHQLTKLGFKGQKIRNILDEVTRLVVCGNLNNDYETINNYVIKHYK